MGQRRPIAGRFNHGNSPPEVGSPPSPYDGAFETPDVHEAAGSRPKLAARDMKGGLIAVFAKEKFLFVRQPRGESGISGMSLEGRKPRGSRRTMMARGTKRISGGGGGGRGGNTNGRTTSAVASTNSNRTAHRRKYRSAIRSANSEAVVEIYVSC
ncbi:hypothetical protein HPP92_012092 [Vanilla planifolia]|uniref:Uncharacterized protein n=1 Tax=Vanilla planifolia TaxID=51239 RepID=A0A835QYV7_VANPL|nr:hypothetical protein HPP92_012092 [Vanilla planifolia]